MAAALRVCDVDEHNWRGVQALKVQDAQRDFVAAPSYYLCLCAYGGVWHPLAVLLNDKVIGFLMWAYDAEEESCWLGGIIIDKAHQRNGYGCAAIQTTIEMLANAHGYKQFALSYQPSNPARSLYSKIGFVETDEWEDGEVIARLSNPNAN